MTPVDEPNEEAEQRYNSAHRSTRNVVKRTIGLLKARFRCLLKHRVLHYDPINAAKIIYSCSVLHNICVDRDEVEEFEPVGKFSKKYHIYIFKLWEL